MNKNLIRLFKSPYFYFWLSAFSFVFASYLALGLFGSFIVFGFASMAFFIFLMDVQGRAKDDLRNERIRLSILQDQRKIHPK